MKVELVSFYDLTKEEQEVQPNNGMGRVFANYLKITHGSETVMLLSDAVEPEDASFTRGLSGVIDAIQKAYLLGLRDGDTTGLLAEENRRLAEQINDVSDFLSDLETEAMNAMSCDEDLDSYGTYSDIREFMKKYDNL